jgi:hypothetical protein
MILEGLITTLDADGSPRIAAMGAAFRAPPDRLVLRPFISSHTFANLHRSRQGVFHITDDVELLARAAVHRIEPTPRLLRAGKVDGVILADACRWYALRVIDCQQPGDRAQMECDVVERGWLRDVCGLNRAKHAVVEAAILATRIPWLPPAQIHDELQRLAPLVEKTGDDAERRAFDFLLAHFQESTGIQLE